MDNLLNKAKGALSGNKSTSSSSTGTTTGAGAGGARKEDYGDKGIDAVEKKFGLDSNKYAKYNEQGSDMARTQIEKATGKDIPDKFSN